MKTCLFEIAVHANLGQTDPRQACLHRNYLEASYKHWHSAFRLEIAKIAFPRQYRLISSYKLLGSTILRQDNRSNCFQCPRFKSFQTFAHRQGQYEQAKGPVKLSKIRKNPPQEIQEQELARSNLSRCLSCLLDNHSHCYEQQYS